MNAIFFLLIIGIKLSLLPFYSYHKNKKTYCRVLFKMMSGNLLGIVEISTSRYSMLEPLISLSCRPTVTNRSYRIYKSPDYLFLYKIVHKPKNVLLIINIMPNVFRCFIFKIKLNFLFFTFYFR